MLISGMYCGLFRPVSLDITILDLSLKLGVILFIIDDLWLMHWCLRGRCHSALSNWAHAVTLLLERGY